MTLPLCSIESLQCDLRQALSKGFSATVSRTYAKTMARIPSSYIRHSSICTYIPECPEELAGILTTNYDEYIEEAIDKADQRPRRLRIQVRCHGREIHQAGSQIAEAPCDPLVGRIRMANFHARTAVTLDETLWIPPGIQKAKQRYPFSVVWGLARELLTCDDSAYRRLPIRWKRLGLHLPVIHRHVTSILGHIGLIRSRANRFPDTCERSEGAVSICLTCMSILEVEEIGAHLMSELSTGAPFDDSMELTKYEQLEDCHSMRVGEQGNWFPDVATN